MCPDNDDGGKKRPPELRKQPPPFTCRILKFPLDLVGMFFFRCGMFGHWQVRIAIFKGTFQKCASAESRFFDRALDCNRAVAGSFPALRIMTTATTTESFP